MPADRLALDPVPFNAVTSDRISNGLIEPVSVLYLRPGRYNLTFSDVNAHVLFQQEIAVTAKNPHAANEAPPPAPASSQRAAARPSDTL